MKVILFLIVVYVVLLSVNVYCFKLEMENKRDSLLLGIIPATLLSLSIVLKIKLMYLMLVYIILSIIQGIIFYIKLKNKRARKDDSDLKEED